MPKTNIQPLLPFLRIYAACGFILSLIFHLLGIAGLQPQSSAIIIGLVMAIFPLWIPVTRFGMRVATGLRRKEAWNAMFSGCPKWMRYTNKILNWYAGANLLAVVFIVFAYPSATSNPDPMPRMSWIVISSYCMTFYFGGLAMLTMVYRKGFPACPNGHPVSLADKYCSTCGAPIPPPHGGEPMRGAA